MDESVAREEGGESLIRVASLDNHGAKRRTEVKNTP